MDFRRGRRAQQGPRPPPVCFHWKSAEAVQDGLIARTADMGSAAVSTEGTDADRTDPASGEEGAGGAAGPRRDFRWDHSDRAPSGKPGKRDLRDGFDDRFEWKWRGGWVGNRDGAGDLGRSPLVQKPVVVIGAENDPAREIHELRIPTAFDRAAIPISLARQGANPLQDLIFRNDPGC